MQCAKCPSKPQLQLQLSKDATRRCYGCGQFVDAVGDKYYMCTMCKIYVTCKNCRICLNHHFMKKVVFLSNTDKHYGACNKYQCDGCKLLKINDDDGVWHCAPCNYDICTECLE